jgi:hypothetical protein
MARRSQSKVGVAHLLPFVACLTSGCIIPDAPDYGPPHQTPIFINGNTISPDPGEIVRFSSTATGSKRFTVSVRSEDAGEDLFTVLLADYKHTGSAGTKKLDNNTLPASTIDKERPVTNVLRLPDNNLGATVNGLLVPSCHSLTMLVMRASEWDSLNSVPIGTPADMASVTWFARVDDDTSTGLLADCPGSGNEGTQ